jgi:hypothetical protein
MTEHYSHVDAGEKNAAVTGMLRLVRGVEPAPENQNEVDSSGTTETEIGTSLGTPVGNRHFADSAMKKAVRTFEILPP